MALKDAPGEVGADACAYLMLTLNQSDDRQALLSDALSSRKKSRSRLIGGQYEKYSQHLSEPLMPRLWYELPSWNLWTMVTATISHGSWWHVIGNPYFFLRIRRRRGVDRWLMAAPRHHCRYRHRHRHRCCVFPVLPGRRRSSRHRRALQCGHGHDRALSIFLTDWRHLLSAMESRAVFTASPCAV